MKRKGMWLYGTSGKRGLCASFQLFSQHWGGQVTLLMPVKRWKNEGSETCPLQHKGSWQWGHCRSGFSLLWSNNPWPRGSQQLQQGTPHRLLHLKNVLRKQGKLFTSLQQVWPKTSCGARLKSTVGFSAHATDLLFCDFHRRSRAWLWSSALSWHGGLFASFTLMLPWEQRDVVQWY